MTDKRYAFAFRFVFDHTVSQEFLADLYAINEPKLKRLGYDVAHAEKRVDARHMDAEIVATLGGNKLIDVVDATAASQQNLLHFRFDQVSISLNNTMLLSPDEKHEQVGRFQYRDGDWTETFNEVTYEFSAGAAKQIVVVTAKFIIGHDPAKWRDSLVYVVKSLHHSAFLAKRLKELVFALQGNDELFKIAAQGKMAAAIAYRSV